MVISAPTGTAAFLFTDVEGSTPLWGLGRAAMATAVAWHDEIVRDAIDSCGGYVFATGGDGFAAAFHRADDAVDAAVALQRALGEKDWPTAGPIRVRCGVHVGDAQERDGDYFGPTVNRAARVSDAGHGGQIVVSSVTAALLE